MARKDFKSVTLDSDTHKILKKLADDDGRSMCRELKYILKQVSR